MYALPGDLDPAISTLHIAEALGPGLRDRRIIQQTEAACFYRAFGFASTALPGSRLKLWRDGREVAFLRITYLRYSFAPHRMVFTACEACREELDAHEEGEIE